MSRTTFAASGRCEDCGAAIISLPAIKGKMIAVDAEPNPRGTMIIRDGILMFGASAEHLRDGEELLMPHFATCGQRKRGTSHNG